MHKYHNIHNIIGCAAALVVCTQVNSAIADYGYGSLDELKAHWRGKPNAIPETFNQLWLTDADSLLWQDAFKYDTGHRFRIEKYGDGVFSFGGIWELASLPEKLGGAEAVRIYKALSSEHFLGSIFGVENLIKITLNQDEGCPTKIAYGKFEKQPFRDGKRIRLGMSVFQKSSKGDIDAEFRFIFEKTGDIVQMVALDGTVEIGSFDENHHRTEQIGHIWMRKPHSVGSGSCSVYNGLRRLPAMYKELQKNFNVCKEYRPFDFWIKDIGNDGFTGEITSPTLLQITNQNFVRRKIASFLQVISSNKFFENVLGKQFWNDMQTHKWEEGLEIPPAEDELKVRGEIRWSADGVNFSENVVANPLALSVHLEIKETEVVNENPNGVSIDINPILYTKRKNHYRNKIRFRFVYDIRTDTIRDAELCPGKLISGDQLQMKVSRQGLRVPTRVQQAQPRHVRQTVAHDFSDVNDFSDLFKFDASK